MGKNTASAQILPIPNYSFSCASNAVAPLESIKDIQTYLNCNGFNPGPIDGDFGNRTTSAIKAFQAASGLVPDGVVGPATKQAMRSYSEESFTFTGSGWGHGVGLSQYGAKGLTELGASFCVNTSSWQQGPVRGKPVVLGNQDGEFPKVRAPSEHDPLSGPLRDFQKGRDGQRLHRGMRCEPRLWPDELGQVFRHHGAGEPDAPHLRL